MVRIGDIENTFITIFTKYYNENAPKAIKLMLKWGGGDAKFLFDE